MNYINQEASLINFKMNLDSKVYVDKSLMIEKICEKIATADRYIFITRPRRFGKTINANMLAAYYTKGYNSHELFDDLRISKTDNYQKHLNQHNVIYIDLSKLPDPCNCYDEYIAAIKRNISESIKQTYSLTLDLGESCSELLIKTGDSFIFILDEWDSIFYRNFMSDEDKNNYLLFLKDLLKDQSYVELAYMTGVLPIPKYSSGSELNMFDEYNFMNDDVFDEYFGFNEDEVRALCLQNDSVSFENMKYWYDGYYMSNGKSLFNPRSVVKALTRNKCLNYWTETGPMNEIADCIEHNIDEVREDIVKLVAGIPIKAYLEGYSTAQLKLDTRDEILSAMVVFGFLSYYDNYLTIPNHELMEKFNRVLSRPSMQGIKKIVDQSRAMLEATLALDEQKVASILELVHDQEIPFLNYNDENSLSCFITLCYLYARNDYEVIREAKSGKGYVDYLFKPKNNGSAIILELKYKRSAREAIEQIKNKNYIEQVKDCNEIILVGINYDGDKKHQCIIEKYNPQ